MCIQYYTLEIQTHTNYIFSLPFPPVSPVFLGYLNGSVLLNLLYITQLYYGAVKRERSIVEKHTHAVLLNCLKGRSALITFLYGVQTQIRYSILVVLNFM